MDKASFTAIHPVIPVRDVQKSVDFYQKKLGFKLLFTDSVTKPYYAGVGRDKIELHLQWHQEENWQQMNACMLRFVIKDIKNLFEEYSSKGVFHEKTALRLTQWHTREFAFYDPDMNGLTFYENI